MELRFSKMQGTGNDYIYVDCFKEAPENPQALAVRLSDRHFGIGADGLVLICPSQSADCFMRMYNSDGSESGMCGNAIRCVGKFLYDRGLAKRRNLSIETKSGVRFLDLHVEQGKADSVSVNMGDALFQAERVPVQLDGLSQVVSAPMVVDGVSYQVTCLSMGNPHCVVYCHDIDSLNLEHIGPCFERHQAFPDRTNTEFVRVLGPDRLKMRVWERGSGETLACGTGACAAAAASVKNGYCADGVPITVLLRGGELTVTCNKSRVIMTGPAAHIFDGVIEL